MDNNKTMVKFLRRQMMIYAILPPAMLGAYMFVFSGVTNSAKLLIEFSILAASFIAIYILSIKQYKLSSDKYYTPYIVLFITFIVIFLATYVFKIA